MKIENWICAKCSFIGPIDAFLFIPDPRPEPNARGWWLCTSCDEIDCVTSACDEPGCARKGSCGFPSPTGYRRTCFEHSIFNHGSKAHKVNADWRAMQEKLDYESKA